jgi:exodeoxyribonuclease-3
VAATRGVAIFEPVRIVSWNVNGLRSIETKGFSTWVEKERPDVVGVQETRARAEQLPDALRALRHHPHAHFVSAERPGYSGVALYSRAPIDAVETSLGLPSFDVEGRVQIARLGDLTIANVYFPNGSGKERDNGRVPYKLRFYRALFRKLEPAFARGEPIVVMGDFNTAPYEIDLARPKENAKTSGFLPNERKELVRWLEAGWVDSFREFERGEGHYSWWSQRFGVRERNVGWRIDLALVSPGARPHLTGARIHASVKGSDHAPIEVELDDRVLGRARPRATARRSA